MGSVKKEKSEEKIGDALLKVALGYQIAEVTEEYAEVDGALKLTKRKKTKKDIPPDLKAVQMLLAGNGGEEYAKWTDEELEKEKKRLLKALEEKGNEGVKEKTKEEEEKTANGENEGGKVEVKEETKEVKSAARTGKTSVVKKTAVKSSRKTAAKSATKTATKKKSAVKKTSAAVK